VTKVMIVLETGSLAGGVRVVGEIANGLANRGHDVSIWSVNDAKTMAWFDLDKKIVWHSFLRTGTTADYDQLADVLKKQDGLKMATFWKTAYAVQYASRPGEGFYLVQDVETSYTLGTIMSATAMNTYGLGIHNVTTSKWVETQIPCDYIGIGVSSFYRPASKSKRGKVPLATSRRLALKGWDVLCETARYLAQRNIFFDLFGIDKTSTMFVKHNYYRFPPDSQVRKLYQEAGCFVSPSRHEGFNLTALEAMACESPVVKTIDDGSNEYSEHNVNCLTSNDPKELASYVERVLKDKDLAKSLAYNGVKTAAKYKWRDVIDRLEALF